MISAPVSSPDSGLQSVRMLHAESILKVVVGGLQKILPRNTDYKFKVHHSIQKVNNLVRPALIAKPRKETTRTKRYSESMDGHLANTIRISQTHTSRSHRSSSLEMILDWKQCA